MHTVLITGGARGMGAAIADELKAKGFSVFAHSRVELDLEKPESIEAFLDKEGHRQIDVLINNAGINVLKTVAELDGLTWQAMLQTNLTAPLRLMQAFMPAMASRGWGRVLNISSIFSLVTKEKRAAYSMTKSALNALTRSAAVEFGPGGVLVNALAPGYVETALTYKNNSPADIEKIKSAIPLRRLAQAAELAKTAAFLCSEDNTYLTGQTVVSDSGFTCQ